MKRLLHRAGRTPLLAGMPREVGVLAAIAFCVALGFGIVALAFCYPPRDGMIGRGRGLLLLAVYVAYNATLFQ